jgi:multidrug efflux pump subunit AcrA (membrane-fusion protein)
MWSWSLLFTLLAALAALARHRSRHSPPRAERSTAQHQIARREQDPAVGEVKPRYESDLSFRVAGKVVSRLVDVGATVKQGDTPATLDMQDYQNRLCSAEADVVASKAARRGGRERAPVHE